MVITLTTDFGYRDPFVGIMKGVITSINRRAQVVDLSHGVPPQDVMAAALMLRHAVAYFPPGTLHVAVVDPGVGSARRPLLVEADGRFFMGPDNGVLSLALGTQAPDQVLHLSNPLYHRHPTSATFHGRDIFAPAAAHLSLGIAPSALGEPVETLLRIDWPTAVMSSEEITGEIIYIDGFGNLFSNIQEGDLQALTAGNLRIKVRDITIHGVAANYTFGAHGNGVALINSWGLLEIALYKDSAERRLQARIGDKVYVTVI